MDRLPPISTPPAQLWREFRVRLVPFVLFASALVCVALMWRSNVAAPTLTGEVETVRANISSPKAGKLTQLNVNRLQRVKAGDVIAQVVTTDPQILQSSLAVVQAEIQLLRVNLEPVLGQQRFAVTYNRLKMDLMEQQVQVVSSRVRLQLAEADLRRAEQLFQQKIVSQQALDAARSAQASLKAEVEERAKLVAEQERKLTEMGFTSDDKMPPSLTNPESVMQASIRVQEEKLRLLEAELSPIQLVVPIDGTVTAVHHRSGEAIAAGEAIVTLAGFNAERVVGYVRQPLTFQPQVGMRVEVRSRSLDRCVTQAQIVEVGGQMEPISSALATSSSSQFHELGLPVLVSLPPTKKLLPGEIVDMRIIDWKGPVSARGAALSEMR